MTGKKEGCCHPIRPERRPFQKVFIDHVGPLPKSNRKQHLIVLVDELTRFVVLEAVQTTNTAAVIRFLEKVFLSYGRPDRLLSGRGTAYTSNAFEQFLKENSTQHVLISTQHAQANGEVERINKEIGRLLRTLSKKEDGTNWAALIPTVQATLNRALCKTTGKSAFETLHGYLPRPDNFSQEVEAVQNEIWRPAEEVQAEVRETILRSQDDYKKFYDMKRKAHEQRYEVGDIVVVKTSGTNGSADETSRQFSRSHGCIRSIT